MATAPASPIKNGRPHRMTTAEYMAMPDDGRQYELFHGLLVMSPSALHAHGRVVAYIASVMVPFVRARKLGVVGTETDIVMQDDTVLRPDLHYISKRNREIIKGHIYGPPELVVEVTSPSNWRTDLLQKRDEYQHFGIREYWLIDILKGHQRAFQWTLRAGKYRGGQVDSKKLQSSSLKGLELNLNDVWELAED